MKPFSGAFWREHPAALPGVAARRGHIPQVASGYGYPRPVPKTFKIKRDEKDLAWSHSHERFGHLKRPRVVAAKDEVQRLACTVGWCVKVESDKR